MLIIDNLLKYIKKNIFSRRSRKYLNPYPTCTPGIVALEIARLLTFDVGQVRGIFLTPTRNSLPLRIQPETLGGAGV
jgi:hypothetical protein